MSAPRGGDSVVRALIDDTGGKRVSDPPRWRSSGSRVEARWQVHNRHGRRVELVMSVASALPWRVHLVLIDLAGQVHVARLDVRDNHENKRTNRRKWRSQTHLHVWSEQWGEHDAIDFPGQCWSDEVRTVEEGEYQRIFQAFCAWCHIEVDEAMAWEDPAMDNDETGHQLEGDIP